LDGKVVSNTAKRVLAQSPSSHVARGVNSSGAPCELHRSVRRNNRVGCAPTVRVPVAFERENALVGEGTVAVLEDASLGVGEGVGIAADRASGSVLVVTAAVGGRSVGRNSVFVVVGVLWVVRNVVGRVLRILWVTNVRENRKRRVLKARVESHGGSVANSSIKLALHGDHWAGTDGRSVVLLLVQADNRRMSIGAHSESTSNVSVLLADQLTESRTVTIYA